MHAGDIGHTLLSNTPASWPSQDLILVTDTASNFMQVSPSSSIILGIRPDEMIGHSAVDFIHPEDLEIARQQMRSAAKTFLVWRISCREGQPSCRA